MNNTTTTKFSLLGRASAWWASRQEIHRQNVLRRTCPAAARAASDIPPAVKAAWVAQAPDEFPGLPVDDGAWLRCSIGLAQFFEVCKLQQGAGPCALPSKGADSVWHVWLQADPTGLAAWQQRHFGRVLEHVEAADLGAPLEEGIARTWAGACRSQGLALLGPRLPLLFALDGQLRLPTGWAYSHERGALVHRQIDGFGRASGPAVAHEAVAAGGLVALGLTTAAELRARRRGDNSGSGCGSSCGSFSDGGGCDGGGGDGGGGSSCGSSCGGGCGGGGD
jgi:hypothetical protein